MKTLLERIREFAEPIAQSRRFRKRAAWTLGIAFVLQLYFVRELIAAELLFMLLFAIVFGLVGIFYVVGTIGERSLDWAEVGVRAAASSSKRAYGAIEEISKKPIRHPHSESAQ